MKSKTLFNHRTSIRLTLWSLLCLFLSGWSVEANAQEAVVRGSQITAENQLVSGKAYLVFYVGNDANASGYMKDTGSAYTGKDDNNPNERAVYYFTDNGDGTWTVKNFYTDKYWGTPTTGDAGNSNTYIGSDTGGAWALNFQGNNNIAPSCNGHSWNRSSSNIHPWSTGTANVNQFQIYEVSISTSALNELTGYEINVSETAADNVTTGQWYVMFDRGANHGWLLENHDQGKIWNYKDKPSGLASEKCMYLVRLVSANNGKYYIQTGYGNYFSTLIDGNGTGATASNNGTTSLKETAYTIAKINSTDGHFYLQDNNSVVMDANDVTSYPTVGGSVVGWGTTPPSTIGGNNDWAFYPVELVYPLVPTEEEVYTINNTLSSRGAMMYNGSSSYVWSSGKSGSFDASNANCQWVFIPTGTSGQYYLYNVGAGKFAIPSGTNSTASWIFSTSAVAITLTKQSDGTYKIKTATTDTYAAVSNGYAGPIINYNDEGGNFSITKIEGDQSTAATAAYNKLVDNQTALTAIPEAGTDSWYVIRIRTHGTYADKYIYPASSEINYSGTYYPLTFEHECNKRPAIDDVTYYTRIQREGGTVFWQLPNGKYLYGSGNKFPISTFTKSSFSMDYVNGSGIRMWGSSRYAVPYLLDSKYFIGETSSGTNAYYDLYPIDLAEAGLTAWEVIIYGGDTNTQLTCTTTGIKGLTSVYNNGYFFIPTGTTPAAADFSMEGMIGSPVINTEDKTITVEYDPTLCFTSSSVTIIQGNETTGKGNTMQALLRIKATPFKACTPTQVNITLTGVDQLDNVAIYTTTNDEIHAAGVTPTKISNDNTPAANMAISLPNASALTAGNTIYFWVTADVKSTAAELSVIDAAITSIDYSNAAGSNSCDLSATGNPEGMMRIYKQQTYLWTPSHANTIYYRIPTMLNTADGGIVALADYRYDHPYDLGKNASNGAGSHKIDVVSRRSTDGGLTWQNEVTVAAGDGSTAAGYGYGDPAIVRDADGTLHCLMAAGNKSYANGMLHMGYSKSTNNGASWSAVTDIYSSIDKAGLSITSAFTTGGKGVTFSNGRMAFAFLGNVSGTKIYPIYSDDKGATWKLSSSVISNGGDETKLEIMNDNRLIASIKNAGYGASANRAYNLTTGDASEDGINEWGSQATWGSEMNATGCNADILYYSRSTENPSRPDIILHTLTKQHATYRKDLRLYMSLDQGATWKEVYKLQPGYAAYSSMQKLANGDLAIIFEDGSIGNKDKQDCYAINYIVISKETIDKWYVATQDMIDRMADKNSFKANSIYTIKNEGNEKFISKIADDNKAIVTIDDNDAATFVIIPDNANAGYFFLYDMQSGKYLVPDNTHINLNDSYWTWSKDPTTVQIRNNNGGDGENAYKAETVLYTLGANRAANNATSGNYVANYQQASPNQTYNHWYIVKAGADAVVELNGVTSAVSAASIQSLVSSAAAAGTQLQYTATVGTAARGTLVIPFDADVPGETVEAYTLESVDGSDHIHGTKVTTIEANKPVLLKNEGSIVLTAKSETLAYTENPTYGLLHGVYTRTQVPNGSYVLQNQAEYGVAFYLVNTSVATPSVNAFRAYLTAGSNTARALTFSFGEETTGINSIDNGQLIMDNGAIYDLQGRKVSEASASSVNSVLPKGLYIINGKKVVIK